MQHLLELVDRFNVELIYADLPPDRDGECDSPSRRVYIQNGLTRRLHRHTLAHELAHVYFGDVPTMCGPVNAKQERRADEWAAMLLIDADDYARAELVRGAHVSSMAHELGVVTRTVEAYQRLLLRVGDAVYVRPRFGAGQYKLRERVA